MIFKLTDIVEVLRTVLRIVIPLAIVAAAVFGFKMLKKSAPEPKKREAKETLTRVPVIEVQPGTYRPPVRTFGTVRPTFETTLTAQVPGRIVEVNPLFRVGNQVPEGTILVTLDQTDYQAAIATQEAILVERRRVSAEEEIRGEQAAADWKASGRDLSKASEFVLRKPQRAAAEAAIASTQAAIEKAYADLDRTQLRAPFDAVVTARSASLGNFANTQATLGTLVATAAVEIPLPLTAEQRGRLVLPRGENEGAGVTFTTPLLPGAQWQGQLMRLAPTISQEQVVTVIAEVAEPFGREPDLALGTFVNAAIEARPLVGAFEIPEAVLVNDAFVWAVTREGTLRKLSATRLQSAEGTAWVSLVREDLELPLQLVKRPLSNFEQGLKVEPIRLAEVKPETP